MRKRTALTTLTCLVGLTLLLSCAEKYRPDANGGGADSRVQASVSLLGTAAAAEDENGKNATPWGTIKGRIVFEGDKVPQRQVIQQVNGHQDQKHCLSKGALKTEDWVVNPKNKGVRWTILWLAPAEAGGKLPIHPDLEKIQKKQVEMDQPCCAFEPHALAIREGQTLIVKNSAPVAHNVRWTGNPLSNPGGNVQLPAGKDLTINLKAQRLPVMFNCDQHKWMNARVAVFKHPYFAVTNEDGNFEIKNAPAGKYRLIVWHESVGWRGGAKGRDGQEIDIKAGGVTNLGDLTLKPKYEDD